MSYTVKSGDTLWGIAQKLLGDGSRWRELGYGGNPNTMPVGTVLTGAGTGGAPAAAPAASTGTLASAQNDANTATVNAVQTQNEKYNKAVTDFEDLKKNAWGDPNDYVLDANGKTILGADGLPLKNAGLEAWRIGLQQGQTGMMKPGYAAPGVQPNMRDEYINAARMYQPEWQRAYTSQAQTIGGAQNDATQTTDKTLQDIYNKYAKSNIIGGVSNNAASDAIATGSKTLNTINQGNQDWQSKENIQQNSDLTGYAAQQRQKALTNYQAGLAGKYQITDPSLTTQLLQLQ